MRCCCCNKNLNDFESTRKHADTGGYLDICNQCLNSLGAELPVDARLDLEPMEFIDQDDDYLDTDEGDSYDD